MPLSLQGRVLILVCNPLLIWRVLSELKLASGTSALAVAMLAWGGLYTSPFPHLSKVASAIVDEQLLPQTDGFYCYNNYVREHMAVFVIVHAFCN